MKHQFLKISELDAKPPPRMLPKLEDIILPPNYNKGSKKKSSKKSTQIKLSLVEIGKQLGFRTWVAQNDKGIIYQNKKLGEMDDVIVKLDDEKLLASYSEAVRAALLIDCIWFKNSKRMPAVIEIEDSTGVTSGLTRMQGFKEALPAFPTRWVIAAPDEDGNKVIEKCNRPQFENLDARFFPYSAIEELYSLCQRRKIRGVTDEFLDCFMEPCRPALVL